MIANRNTTRKNIRSRARGIFIIFALTFASRRVVSVSAVNTTNNCGGDFSGYQYAIKSPNYPDNYPEQQDCVYVLHGSHLAKCDQVFHLQFLDFALEASENCEVDYLKIGNRSFYCGSVVGIRSYRGKNNSLELRFHSAATRGGKGFKILVTTSPCDSEREKENYANSTKKISTDESNLVATQRANNTKIVWRNDPEITNLLESEDSYPVYRPEVNFAIEDNRQIKKADTPPLRIQIFEKNDDKLQRIHQEVPQYLADSLELPVRQNPLFRDPAPTKLEIVTPTSTKTKEGPKISAYLFVPPPAYESTGNLDFPRSSSKNLSKDLKNDVDQFVTQPPTDLRLPNHWTTIFRETPVQNFTRKLPVIQDHERSSNKFVVPARSYGVPDAPYYPPMKAADPEIKTGEVLENSGGPSDCYGTPNLAPDLEVTANFRNENPVLINAGETGSSPGIRSNYYPATTYGLPGSNYPTNVPNTLFNKTPNFNYAPGASYYPENGVVTGSVRPNIGFPTNNVGNRYPNFSPPPGIFTGGIFPGSGRYSDCCSTVYSSQRFLLASPGFPAFLYYGNSYECVYTIRSYSPSTCQMRFNFKFFNHGTEDRFCSYGYVEIDGRRVCGCKKGLSIVSPVSSAFPKTIGVRYAGYPRTKFNGFLIEVIQEPCTNDYPFGSRRKKDVGNSTLETIPSDSKVASSVIVDSSSHRTKRNLGYSYPRPNIGLIEVPGASQSWNTGSSLETGIHQLLNDGGTAANLFSPILSCQALSIFDWILAAKEVYLRNARCVKNGGTGNTTPGPIPNYPGGWVPGTPPGYPGIGGPGITVPYPGNGGSGAWNPVFPGGGGSGTINPSYPGNGGSGSWNPGFPSGGGSGTINPSYPGNGGSGSWNAGFPSGGGSGTINPGYPGNWNPGFPSGGGTGTINPSYPGSGSWNGPAVKCEDINVAEGIISSPQYPLNYPNNVNKCFKFYKAPGFCQLELAILDFDLENSVGCTKDYVAFSGRNRRYCGRSLAGSKTLLDISRCNSLDMYFVSDGFGSGRGFSAGFSQIPCRSNSNR